MATSSFSRNLANLLVGLSRGSKRLEPYSKHFRSGLGYGVFRFEQSFFLADGRTCHPDAILTSATRSTALVLEWTTTTEVGTRKKEQIDKYVAVTQSDLVTNAGVKREECGQHDCMLILQPQAVAPYATYLNAQSHALPILAFAEDETGFYLKLAGGAIKDGPTHAFFEKGVTGRFIPTFWVKFALDEISEEDLVDSVISGIVQRITRGPQSFRVRDFAKGLTPVWSQLSKEVQGRISTVTGAILAALSNSEDLSPLLKRASPGPGWTVIGLAQFQRRAAFYHNRLELFRNRTKKESPLQPTLFD